MFGVFVRSVGERTEGLCYESCRAGIPAADITVIRNVFPAHRAFERMFQQARDRRYDWFLGLDADIVLKPDWFDIAQKKKEQMQGADWYVFTFCVEDKFLGAIDRGNHFYNGRYAGDSLRVLRTRTRHMLKPESKIRHYVAAPNAHFNDILIGYHGYEQFLGDIFYRFWLQAQRDPSLEKKHPFLKAARTASPGDDPDVAVARQGWQAGKQQTPPIARMMAKLGLRKAKVQSDASLRSRLVRRHLPHMREKTPLSQSLERFVAASVDGGPAGRMP